MASPDTSLNQTLLMDSDALVAIFRQIASDPYLPKQVLSFLSTLAEESQGQA